MRRDDPPLRSRHDPDALATSIPTDPQAMLDAPKEEAADIDGIPAPTAPDLAAPA